jgi:small-conductance mechanosensitive channel
LNYELVFSVRKPDQQSMLDARQRVMIAVIRRFGELDIQFAFPAQMSFLAGPDGHIVDPYPEAGTPSRQAHPAGRQRTTASRTTKTSVRD